MSVLSALRKGTSGLIKRQVVVVGQTDIMFDRYAGDNNTELQPWDRAYYAPDGKTFVLPSLNIMSFLSGMNTSSAPKRLLDPRKYKKIAAACLSYIQISPMIIPFMRDGKPIILGTPDGDRDEQSGAFITYGVARLEKGIPNPKARPTLPVPWSLMFNLDIFPNDEIQEQQICDLFVRGGLALGFGTYRGVYGKFVVESWDERID